MGNTTKIQWTDKTWNPWHGCAKVSEGCKYCYMFRDKERYNQDPTTVLRSKSGFFAPRKWAFDPMAPLKIFTCSWSDWFIEDADEWRKEAWETIRMTPWFTYQILTKRPERIAECLPEDWGGGYPNVWLGVSVENTKNLHRIETLAGIPAAIRFVSAEPLIGPLVMTNEDIHYFGQMDWVIIGGESGNDSGKYRYRPCALEWILNIVMDAERLDVAVFIKQMGTHLAKEMKLKDRHGGDAGEWAQGLRIRNFPNINADG